MKRNLTLILLILILTSCFSSNYESERIKSPTGNFEINATVNRNDKDGNNYADVIINLYDENQEKLTKINTGAGDANKWAIGWTESGDTMVLQSSDIGNKVWVFRNKQPIEVAMTDRLNKRAEYLKSNKYK